MHYDDSPRKSLVYLSLIGVAVALFLTAAAFNFWSVESLQDDPRTTRADIVMTDDVFSGSGSSQLTGSSPRANDSIPHRVRTRPDERGSKSRGRPTGQDSGPRPRAGPPRADSGRADDGHEETSDSTTKVSHARFPLPQGAPGVPPEPPEGVQRIIVTDDLSSWMEATGSLDFQGRAEDGRAIQTWVGDAAGSQRLHISLPDAFFVYWVPGSTGSLVGYSSASPSREEAVTDALRTALEKVAALALLRLKHENPSLDVEGALPLAFRLSEQDPRFGAKDECLQFSDRGYGPIYRAAVRIEAQDEALDELALSVREEVLGGWIAEQKKLGDVLWTGASVLVLAFAIFLLYTFLNAGTKGHFAVPLRILSAAIFFLLCAVVFYVRAQLDGPGSSAVRQASAQEASWTDRRTDSPTASLRKGQAESLDGRRKGSGGWRPIPDRRDRQGVLDRVPAARRQVRRTAEGVCGPPAVR